MLEAEFWAALRRSARYRLCVVTISGEANSAAGARYSAKAFHGSKGDGGKGDGGKNWGSIAEGGRGERKPMRARC